MKPLIYSGETFRNYQQEIVERFSMGTAKRHHEVNKVNGCGRPFGRLARSRHFPSSDPMGARRSKIRERQLYIALHVGRGEHIAPATVRALVEKGVRPFFKDDVQ